MKKAENIQKVAEFLSLNTCSDIDYHYHLEGTEFNTADDVRDILEDAGALDIEIIYYTKAMEYLMNEDTSLTESLKLAHDMGFTAESLNSETLASILATERAREAFYSIENELQDLIDELEEEEQNEEETEEEEQE